VLKHPLLRNKPVIGRGAYSIIFGNESTVLKLTIDRVAYELAEQQSQWKCSALPVIHGLHGIIGELDYGAPLSLIEMEPLVRLKTGSSARKRCLSIGRKMRPFSDGEVNPAEGLRYVSSLQSDEKMAQALILLSDFLEPRWPSTKPDLHGSNFMQRPENGEAVITDPFMDLQTRANALENYRQKRGLPEGTMFL
jgi:hypothetical protein